MEICGEVVQIYAGLRDQELRAAAAEYVREFVRDRYFPEMVSLMAALRGAGVELWAVSSTNKWIIVEGVRDFGIPEERVLAVEVRVEGGIIGNEIVDLPTGEGKAEALAAWACRRPTRSSATRFTTWRCWRWRATPSR